MLATLVLVPSLSRIAAVEYSAVRSNPTPGESSEVPA